MLHSSKLGCYFQQIILSHDSPQKGQRLGSSVFGDLCVCVDVCVYVYVCLCECL